MRNAILLITLVLGVRHPAQAASITWSGPSNITGESNVSTSGSLIAAYNLGYFGVSSTTVNGVQFAPFVVPRNSNGATVGNFAINSASLLSSDNSLSGSNNPLTPFYALSNSYKILLSSYAAAVSSSGPFTLTISGLLIGTQYAFEWWANNSIGGRSTCIATAGNTVSLTDNYSGLAGWPGQYAIGTFSADSNTQVINFGGNGTFGFMNGFQLRSLSGVPEGGPTWIITSISFATLIALRRWKRTSS